MFVLKASFLFLMLFLSHFNILKCLLLEHQCVFLISFFTLCSFMVLSSSLKKNNFSISAFLFFLLPFLLNLINTYFIHSNTLAMVSLIVGVMAIFNLFFDKVFSIYIFWLAAIFCMLLPVKEYFQIFLGVPMRLFSASFLENVFLFLNIDMVQFGSLLLFENKITNIDIPCSGSVTIHYSLIFILLISFLKGLRFDISWVLKTFVTLFLASFLNTFRIFLLVLFSIFGLQFFADKIHVLLGMINYFVLCIFFIFLTKNKKYDNKIEPMISFHPFLLLLIFSFCLSFLVCLRNIGHYENDFKTISKPENALSFSSKELSLFEKYGSSAEKYFLDDVVIIKIGAKNFLGMHNPLLCLRAQGFKVIKDETLIADKNLLRYLETDKGYVYFYFSDGINTTDDYYKAAFELFLKKEVTLVIVYSKNPLSAQEVLKF